MCGVGNLAHSQFESPIISKKSRLRGDPLSPRCDYGKRYAGTTLKVLPGLARNAVHRSWHVDRFSNRESIRAARYFGLDTVLLAASNTESCYGKDVEHHRICAGEVLSAWVTSIT